MGQIWGYMDGKSVLAVVQVSRGISHGGKKGKGRQLPVHLGGADPVRFSLVSTSSAFAKVFSGVRVVRPIPLVSLPASWQSHYDTQSWRTVLALGYRFNAELPYHCRRELSRRVLKYILDQRSFQN